MTSPSAGEGHKFTSNSHLIYSAVVEADGVCICKNVSCLLVLGLSVCMGVCICAFMYFLLLSVKI